MADVFEDLLIEAGCRLIDPNGKWPITWVIGDSWVVLSEYWEWTVGPDEPATEEQIRELLARSGGTYDLQDYL